MGAAGKLGKKVGEPQGEGGNHGERVKGGRPQGEGRKEVKWREEARKAGFKQPLNKPPSLSAWLPV